MAANQNVTQLTQQTGSAALTSLFYAVTGGAVDTGLPLSVLVNNLGLTGTPTTPTAVVDTNSTQIASTAYVVGQGYLKATLAATTYAPLASPALTGTPTAPTAATADNTTKLATTAYVQNNLGSYLTTTLAASTYAALTGATFTGNVSIISSVNNGNQLAITQTGSAGANINLTGNGGTTPTKYLRVNTGAFQIMNSAYSTAILNLTDVGNLSTTGGIDNTSVGATTPSTGSFTTLVASGTITPSQTSGIVGTTTNNQANTGSVGEVISSTVLAGSAVSLTANVAANVTSISLTAGDWDVWGLVATNPAGTTTQSNTQGTISTVSATFPTAPNGGAWALMPFTASAGSPVVLPVGQIRLNLSTTTTVYLVIQSNFGVSTNGGYGFLGARRRR